jgi:sugar phosphate isomerase/epimerase
MSTFSRREFGKLAAMGTMSLAALGSATSAAAAAVRPLAQSSAVPSSPWASRMGLELFTVRDRIAADQVGTLTKVAAIGYKEVEPSVTIDNLPAKQYRALLDRLGLIAPTSHMSVSPGPDLEQQLEDCQIMGTHYVSAAPARPAPSGRSGARGGARRGAGTRGGARGAVQRPAPTPDSYKKTVDMYNQVGAVAQKYGVQVLVHNHAMEFERFPGSDQVPYDIILAEADPKLVVMELDIGWASVAGQDIVALFQKHPGRFVLWHVKDFMDLQYLFPQPEMTESQRMQVAGKWMVPVGLGGIDWKTIFAHAELAGMKHFNIEQDNADSWGDSIAAAGVSYRGLLRELSA